MGDILRTYREHIPLDLGVVARESGISRQHLSEIEKGKCFLRLDTLLAVLTALDWRLQDFAIRLNICLDRSM